MKIKVIFKKSIPFQEIKYENIFTAFLLLVFGIFSAAFIAVMERFKGGKEKEISSWKMEKDQEINL